MICYVASPSILPKLVGELQNMRRGERTEGQVRRDGLGVLKCCRNLDHLYL